jgi:hypothetical protein
MFTGVTLSEFNSRFKTDSDCLSYLYELKWGNGFKCRKCNHSESRKGNSSFDRRCLNCGYEESATAQTLFHKVKFSLRSAFYICYRVCVAKKGMSSTELSRELGLRQMTCWAFKRKVQQAMSSSGKFKLTGQIEVDEFAVGGVDAREKGRSKGRKKLVALIVERKPNNKIGRVYAHQIEDYSAEEIGQVLEKYVDQSEANIKADCWRAYTTLSKSWNINQVKSNQGKNFEKLHTVIMNFKGWLRGIHHKCSQEHMQGYLNEYCYRMNRRNHLKTAFHKLIDRMVTHIPIYHKDFAF